MVIDERDPRGFDQICVTFLHLADLKSHGSRTIRSAFPECVLVPFGDLRQLVRFLVLSMCVNDNDS